VADESASAAFWADRCHLSQAVSLPEGDCFSAVEWGFSLII